jgi:hypothetical protein
MTGEMLDGVELLRREGECGRRHRRAGGRKARGKAGKKGLKKRGIKVDDRE